MMNKKTLAKAGLALCCIAAAGCGTVEYQVQSSKPVMLGSALPRDYRVIRHVEDEGKKLWLFWWLLPAGERRDMTLSRFADAGGDAVVNVTIHESYDIVDFLVQNWSALIGVAGVTNTLNQDYTADIVDYQKGDDRR